MTTSPTHGDEPIGGPPEPLLYNAVYCSRAAAGLDADSLAAIVASAQRWNPVFGITGLLVLGSGIFFQWLEGPRASVTQLLTMLRADARHDTVVLLSEVEEVRERLFPTWDMELVGAGDIRDVLQDALSTAEDPHNAAALRQLLQELDSGQLQGLHAA